MSSSGAERVLDTSRPHAARMYDYYLGGSDHFEVDRRAGETVARVFPDIFVCARELRRYMHRSTRVLAQEHGIRQWLDIGAGIPTEPNLHQVAQAEAPEARIVYIDNDPLVLKYAERLMISSARGRIAYAQGDLREPAELLRLPEVREVLDLSRPVALSMNAVLHFVQDEDRPYEAVARLVDALAPGSFLSLTHVTGEFEPLPWQRIEELYRTAGTPGQVRSAAEVRRFFEGLELLEPGVVTAHRWRPDAVRPVPRRPGELRRREDAGQPTDSAVSAWGGVAIKR